MGLLTERVKRQRMRKVAPYIRGDLLDIGCGTGLVLDYVQDVVSRYVGIERHARRVQHNQETFPEHTFFRRDLDKDELALDGAFDTILMVAVIEHIYNQRHLFEQVLAHLKPKGRLVVTTPTPFGNDVVHRMGAAAGLFSKDAAADHIVIYNHRRFLVVAQDFGLRLEHYARFQVGCNQIAVLRRADS